MKLIIWNFVSRIPGVANLFVRESHLFLFKHKVGRTTVFTKH